MLRGQFETELPLVLMQVKGCIVLTRMHSSRMRITRLLPLSPNMHCGGGMSAPGGVCSWGVCSGGICSGGRCLPRGVSAPGGGVCSGGRWGVCSQDNVCSGGCLLWGEVSAQGWCLLRRVSALGEVGCLLQGNVFSVGCLLPGGCLLLGGVCPGMVSAPRGMSAPEGVCSGGVCHSPSHGQNDRQV